MYKIDYDLFVLDPDNINTREDQFRDCLYDALKTLNQRVENLESALDTQRRLNQKSQDFIYELVKRVGELE